MLGNVRVVGLISSYPFFLLFFKWVVLGGISLLRILYDSPYNNSLFSHNGVRTCPALIKTEGLITPLTIIYI